MQIRAEAARQGGGMFGRRLFLLGLGLAAVSWFAEAALDTLVFRQGAFVQRILPDDPNEIWMRLMICGLFVFLGWYGGRSVAVIAGMERSLREERNFITSVLDTVGALILVVDREGRITLFNRECEKTTGYSAADVIGRSIGDVLLAGEDAGPVREEFGKLLAGRFPASLEYHWLTRGGDRRLIAWANTALTDDGAVKYVISTGIDVTEQRRLEKERQNLLGMFAHDMKNPVVASAGYLTRLIEGKAGCLDEKQVSNLGIIRDELAVVERLVRDFLEYSRIEAGEYRPAWRPVDIRTSLSGIVAGKRAEALKKGITIEFKAEERVPQRISADGKMLERVVTNLLDNALKYSRGGGIVTVQLTDRDSHIGVAVSDQGIGIPAEHVPHIFEPFYRAENDEGGTGLGLCIVKRIVEAHGGTVRVHSTEGDGSTFYFTIPKKTERKT